MLFQPATIYCPSNKPPPAATNSSKNNMGRVWAISLMWPFPASVSIGAPARTRLRTFPRETRSVHRAHPTSLAEADQVHTVPQLCDSLVNVGEVSVDIEILHLLCRAFPISNQHSFQPASLQSLDQTLTFGVVSNRGTMPRIGSVNQHWYIRAPSFARGIDQGNYLKTSLSSRHSGQPFSYDAA